MVKPDARNLAIIAETCQLNEKLTDLEMDFCFWPIFFAEFRFIINRGGFGMEFLWDPKSRDF